MELIKTELNEELGLVVNVYGTVEEPLFNAGEVALSLWRPSKTVGEKTYPDMNKLRNALSINNSALTPKVFISETQYYRAILKSNSIVAEPLYDWLSGEVLPSIRKTGGYVSEDATQEQIDHLDENNLIELVNSGRQPGRRIKRIFNNLSPSEIMEKLNYIYPNIKSDNRYYFLKRLEANITEMQLDYRKSSDTFSSGVYEEYNKILLFANKSALEYKNRSTGKIIAGLIKKAI